MTDPTQAFLDALRHDCETIRYDDSGVWYRIPTGGPADLAVKIGRREDDTLTVLDYGREDDPPLNTGHREFASFDTD